MTRSRHLRFWRVTALAALAAASACADTLIGPAPAPTNAAVFDELWRDVDLHYPFFEYKHLNWDSLGAVYRPRAVAAASDADLARTLGALLEELRDAHVSLSVPSTGATYRYLSRAESSPYYFDANTTARYVRDDATTPGGHVAYGMLSADVGYARIAAFAGAGWSSEIDDALTAMPAAQALVLDVRGNRGGTRSIAIDVAGRFADRARTFGYLRFRNGPSHDNLTAFSDETVAPAGARHFAGQVYVLTDRLDFSSTEELVLAMRALPTTTIVGDTTGGASGGPAPRELSNGWTYELSEWMEYTTNHELYEEIGLAPDVAVPTTATDMRSGRDVPLERALALAEARERPVTR